MSDEDLILATMRGDFPTVKLFIEQGFSPNTRIKNGSTLLDIAIMNGYNQIIMYLIQHGADVNTRDDYKMTPLMHALSLNDIDIIRALIDKGADVNAIDDFNYNIITHASTRDPQILLELLDQFPNIDINLQDTQGYTPLMTSVNNDEIENAKILIDHGADINTLSTDRHTPLLLAAENDNQDMVDFLLDSGAIPILETPLDFERAYHTPLYPIPRYTLTGRPITDMSYLRTKKMCTGKHYLPVIRYQSLYYEKLYTTEKFCGTFYFFEPSSEYFLSLGRFLIANNKVDAYLQLTMMYNETPVILDEIEKDDIDASLSSVILEREKDASELHPFQRKELTPLYYDETGEYRGKDYLGHYDKLDQAICWLARKSGFNTVILQREPGETRVVTEILDTRPREESFQNFCQIRDITFHQLASKSCCPTIWFKSYGVLTL